MAKRTRAFPFARSLGESLAYRFEVQADGCWIWQGARQSGQYGCFKWRNPKGRLPKTDQAHAWVWLLAVGRVPEGLELDHLCRNRLCVNPDHLEPVTHLENVRRGKGTPTGVDNHNGAKTHCPHGHPYDVENTYVTTVGRRQCRTCRRDWIREYRARQCLIV